MTDFKTKLQNAKKRNPLSPPNPMVDKLQDAMRGRKPAKETTALQKASTEAVAKLGALQVQAKTITKITTDDEYLEVDKIRGEVDAYLKWWEPQYREVKDPLLQATQALDKMNRTMTQPALTMKAAITGLMADYKRGQLRAKQEAEQEELERAEALRRQAEKVKAPALKAKLEAEAVQAQEVAQQIAEVQTVQGNLTHDRIVKKWRITSLRQLLAGIMAGDVPEDVLLINEVQMNSYFKEDAKTFSEFPGVEIYEDVQIIGGQRRSI